MQNRPKRIQHLGLTTHSHDKASLLIHFLIILFANQSQLYSLMRNHQKFRQFLLPKIETFLTEKRLLQVHVKDKHIQKEVLEELQNIKFQLPSARLIRESYPYGGSSYSVALRPTATKGSIGRNKENLGKRENVAMFVPGRYYQLKKQLDCDEIFIKRNQVNDWSRKSALYGGKQSQEKRKPTARVVPISKTEEVKLAKEELSGWQHIDDSLIERIIMES